MPHRLHRASLALLALLGLTPAGVLTSRPAGAQTLDIGIGGSITSVDPHFYNAAPNNSLSMHIFDRLVERDAKAQPYAGLAASWRPVSETVWEFKLRPGVTWHDGKPFTADDVAFTIERTPNVPNSPGGFGGFVRAITRVEVVDPLTVHFYTARPHPLLPTELASVAVISRHAGQGASTEDYNSGKAAIGTGPYRLGEYRSGDRTVLLRNDRYWGRREHWERVNYRFIGNDGPFVQDNDGKPLAANPFNDIRVRRALSLSLHRQALAERVMEGTAQPTGQWLPPGTFGYNPDVTVPRFDPDQAKRLLAEAGFPNGFRMTLHSPNDRYPNDARTAQAVAQMWTRIGVRTEVEALPWASFAARSNRQEFGMRLAGWGSTTGEASYTLVNITGTYDRAKLTGASNVMRYSNPALDALTERAVATLDNDQRAAQLREGVRVAMDDLAFIPLFQLVNSWALKRGLAYEARMDERTVAMGVRPQ